MRDLFAPSRDRERRKRFDEFHALNPHVFKEFEKLALDLVAAGRIRYSARTILEVMRWNRDISTISDDGLKLNDHWSAFYARLFVELHPEHSGLFVMKGDHA